MKRSTPSEEQKLFNIGWLAGIIDGEGSIAHYYSKRKDGGKKSPSYGVYIINSDMEILNHVKSIYNDLGIYANINLKSSSRRQNENSFKFSKPCYEMVVRRRLDVEKLLKLVTPHLKGYKKQKSQDLLDFFLLNSFNSKKQVRV